MSIEEQNRSFYKETFEELPVPEGLAEKVGKISEGTEKRKRTAVGGVMRKVAIAAAILVVLFAGSNGIAYATTGETWVEKIMLKVKIEGIEYEVEAEKRQIRNEKSVYVGDIELENGEKGQVTAVDGGEYLYYESVGAEVWSSDGRTYIWDGDLEFEITDDLEDDGRAVGTYEVDGILKGYSIGGKEGDFSYWMEILEEGMEGPDWTTKWTLKQFEDKIDINEIKESYEPSLVTPIPVTEP